MNESARMFVFFEKILKGSGSSAFLSFEGSYPEVRLQGPISSFHNQH